jgi:starch synthase
MRILLASSEVHPYSKTGGLADMVSGLSKTLARAGHRVGVVTPLYAGIEDRFSGLSRIPEAFDLPVGPRRITAGILALEAEEGLTIYFVEQPGFYQRAAPYGVNGTDFADNAERFVFFSKAVVELARRLPWRPELIHAHDWQTGLVPLLLLEEARQTGWPQPPRTCITVHNLAYQGLFPRHAFALTGLSWEHFHSEGVEFYGQLNCLKAGLLHAAAITTVSPRYAREIMTGEFGCGLDGLLLRRRHALTGILNGADYGEWNTTGNPFLEHSFSPADLSGKARQKSVLQRELGLPVDPSVPLFGSINRLVEQKGVEIQLAALDKMLGEGLQFVLLGSGDPGYQRAYQELADRHSDRMAVRFGFDQGLSHRIEAGCDFFLMPSRFEPCGLNQLYSLRYGTVPIVRATGGLDDSVIDAQEDSSGATGIKFRDYSSQALIKAVGKALALYAEPEWMAHYRCNGMAADFSWQKTAASYQGVYQSALNL